MPPLWQRRENEDDERWRKEFLFAWWIGVGIGLLTLVEMLLGRYKVW